MFTIDLNSYKNSIQSNSSYHKVKAGRVVKVPNYLNVSNITVINILYNKRFLINLFSSDKRIIRVDEYEDNVGSECELWYFLCSLQIDNKFNKHGEPVSISYIKCFTNYISLNCSFYCNEQTGTIQYGIEHRYVKENVAPSGSVPIMRTKTESFICSLDVK